MQFLILGFGTYINQCAISVKRLKIARQERTIYSKKLEIVNKLENISAALFHLN